MLGELIGLVKQLLPLAQPMLFPDEVQKITAKIEKIEKERDEKSQKFLAVLESGDVAALNLLLAELLGEL